MLVVALLSVAFGGTAFAVAYGGSFQTELTTNSINRSGTTTTLTRENNSYAIIDGSMGFYYNARVYSGITGESASDTGVVYSGQSTDLYIYGTMNNHPSYYLKLTNVAPQFYLDVYGSFVAIY